MRIRKQPCRQLTMVALGIMLGLVLLALSVGISRSASTPVHVTFYTDYGVTYSGAITGPGVAGCSWNFPLYTVLRFPDGRVVTCLDRGILGCDGHVDIWMPSYWDGIYQVELVYGHMFSPPTQVEILQWGTVDESWRCYRE